MRNRHSTVGQYWFVFATCFTVLLVASRFVDAAEQEPAVFSQFLPTLEGNPDLPCRYTGAFQQKRKLSGLNRSLSSRGKFLFDCDRGMIWEVQDPAFNSLIYTHDGKHYRVGSRGKIKQLEGKAQSRMAKTLLDLLGGNTEALRTEFDISVVQTGADNSSGPSAVNLVPRRQLARQFVKEIVLTASAASLQVYIDSAESGTNSIDIVNVQEFNLDCVNFIGDKYKGCDLLQAKDPVVE